MRPFRSIAAAVAVLASAAACAAPAPEPHAAVADDTRPGVPVVRHSGTPDGPFHIGPAAGSAVADAAVDAGPLSIGNAAADSVGGYLRGDTMLSPFDNSTPAIAWLDPALRDAIQKAARGAAADGIDLKLTSGWRSRGFQQRLLDDGVRTYGSLDAARRYVATPEGSNHVLGEAVDVGPAEAAEWMVRNGRRFGLCQIFANENWHFELAADERGNCPPLRPDAAG